MRIETQLFREYEIQATLHSPLWQGAIYPTRPGLPKIDWENKRIEAAGVHAAFQEAQTRINMVLSGVLAS
jgi:hypothetical protein